MKSFTILSIFCLIACTFAMTLELNEEQKAKAKMHFEKCIKQENVSAEDATRIHNEDYANPSPSMKCFATCFFEEVGTLKNGQIQEDVVLQKLGSLIGEEKTKEVLGQCKNVKGADRCDTGFKIYECLERLRPKLGL